MRYLIPVFLWCVLLLIPSHARASILLNFQSPITAKEVVVFDVTTDTLMLEKNGYEPRPIASLTKLMTAVVFLDTHTSFNKKVTITQKDQSIGSRLGLKNGSIVTTGDLFHAMLSVSANDAAKALVRSSGLTHTQFIQRMNKKALSWGLKSTHFAEETGLSPDNVSTAVEYALLAKRTLDKAKIANATTLKTYTFKNLTTKKSITIKNKNPLLGSELHITGTKTGFIDESDLNLMARSEKDGRTLIAVVLGSHTGGSYHFKEVTGLLEAAWKEKAPLKPEKSRILATPKKEKLVPDQISVKSLSMKAE